MMKLQRRGALAYKLSHLRMDLSLFLAQAFGLYFVIAGAAMLLQPRLVQSIIGYMSDRERVAMSGFLILIIGVPLILIHNVWDGSWAVLITVIAWITFVKGLVRVLLPDTVLSWTTSLGNQPRLMKLLVLLSLLVGLYLLYVGFEIGV